MKLSAGSVRLSAKGAVAVKFTVTVPAATAPGDYVAALAAQTPKPKAVAAATSNKAGVSLVTTTRVIVAVVVDVPGPAAPAAHFGPPSIGLQQDVRQVITIPIYDTGNVLMKPYLAGNLRRCSGGPVVLSLAEQLDTFVPRHQHRLSLVSAKPGPLQQGLGATSSRSCARVPPKRRA